MVRIIRASSSNKVDRFRASTSNLFILVVFLLLANMTTALQFVLSDNKPFCIFVQPKTVGSKLTVQYYVNGKNDEQLTFTATQNGRQLQKVIGGRDQKIALGNRGS